MNKKVIALLIVLISVPYLVNGCLDFSKLSSGSSLERKVPASMKNIALNAIYGNITPDQVERIMMTPDIILAKMGLPEESEITLVPESYPDDPNMLKSYLRYRRSESLIKEGMPTRKYKEITNEFLDFADQYPDIVALQRKVVDHYLGSNKQYAAIRQAKKVLSIDPNDMDTAIAIAAVYNETGRYEDALRYLNLALKSDQSAIDNTSTAIATLHMAGAFAELGHIYAAAETYLRTWQLMRYHRKFEQYDPAIQKIIDSAEFQLLISARLFLQCGKIDACIQTLRQVRYGPNFQQLIGYLTPMVIELPEPQKVRFKMLVNLYVYLLADGEDPDVILKLFYNNCLKMSLHNEYIKVVQGWYGLGMIESSEVKLVSRHNYARALEYAKRHTEARLVLKNCQPGNDTAATWLDFARIDRTNKSYNDMLEGYINCIDAGPQNLEIVLKEFEDILQYDREARDSLVDAIKIVTGKNFGLLIVKALIADNAKQNVLAEKLYHAALNKNRKNVVARKYLIRYFARVGKYQNLLVLAKGYDQPEILMYVARAYQSLGKFNKAVSSYKQILSKDRYNEQAVVRLAGLYRSLKQFSDAESLLLRSSRRHPEQDLIQVELIKLYSVWSTIAGNSDSGSVDSCVDRVYLLAANYSTRYSNLANSQKRAETLLQENLEDLLESYKMCKPARVILCDSYYRTKKFDSAVSHASRLINMFSDDYQVVRKAAEIFDSADKYELAAAARKIIWQKHEQTAGTLLAAMTASRYAGLPSESLSMLNAGIKLFPSDTGFIKEIANEAFKTYLILRNYGEGIDSISRWLEACQGDCDSGLIKSLKYKLSLLFIYDSRFEQAAKKLLALYTESPDTSIFAAQMLVRSLNIRGMYDTSVAFLEELKPILEQDIFITLEYAYTLIEAGHTSDAIKYVENWQQENPEASNRQYTLFNTYKRAGRYQQAIDLTRMRLRDNSGDVDLLVDLVYCLIHLGDERSLNEAAGILDSLAEINVDPYKWFDFRIILDLTRGNPEVASERLMQMTSDPDSPAILAAQARIYYLSGDNEKAIKIFKQLIEDLPDEIYYRSQYSFVLENAGHIDEAIDQLNKIHEDDSDNAMSINNLAYTMINHNRDPERAGRLIREAIYMAPENVAILDSVGWLYYKQGDFQTAIDYIFHAAAADIIVDPELMDHLGDTSYRLGQKEKAIVYWQRGLKEINRRVVMEKNLLNIKERYQRKVEQYNSGKEVDVAPLFSEIAKD